MQYPKSYFDKWYRSSQRVHSHASRARTVRMVLALGDYMLGRAVRTVIDIGAGEGQWFLELRKLRPTIRYVGVDPSEYAVRRYGRSRSLVLGSLGNLPDRLRNRRYDLVVCSGVLNYLPLAELKVGFATIASLASGVAFLELFTNRDEVHGDTRGRRRAKVYRDLLRLFGYRHCGPHCYIAPEFEGTTVEMELA
jgi:SAM-dependent methyltransferase